MQSTVKSFTTIKLCFVPKLRNDNSILPTTANGVPLAPNAVGNDSCSKYQILYSTIYKGHQLGSIPAWYPPGP